MSNTVKDASWSRKAKADPKNFTAVEEHRGCPLDPTGCGRRRVTVETIKHAPNWHKVTLPCKDCAVFDTPLDRCHHKHRVQTVFGPWTETIEHVTFEVVECDIDAGGNRFSGQCWRRTVPKRPPHFYTSVPRKWTRDFYYAPERREVRGDLHEMMLAFNSGADLDDYDDPYSPAAPSGLYGGGYID